MLNLALLSFWHVHAVDYAAEAEQHPEAKLVAVWDELPERGQREAERRHVRYYARLDELLAQPDLDGVIVTTPTSLHPAVMIAAAQAGKHIFTEKVIAATLAQTKQITEAVAAAGVKLVVSLPRLYTGYTLAIQQLLAGNVLGDLTQVRVRLAHDGALPTAQAPAGGLPAHFFDPQTAIGGALLDLGCHPVYLTRLFLGMPHSVQAIFGYLTHRQLEDNAVVTFAYDSGALGLIETGFVTPGSPFSIEIHGTAGSLFYGGPEAKLRLSERVAGQITWTGQPLSPEPPSAFEQWVTHIQQGTLASENIALATDLSALMEAAYRSAASGQAVALSTI